MANGIFVTRDGNGSCIRLRSARIRPIYKGLRSKNLNPMDLSLGEHGAGLSPDPHMLDPCPTRKFIYVLEKSFYLNSKVLELVIFLTY